jgi:hypothetical protein
MHRAIMCCTAPTAFPADRRYFHLLVAATPCSATRTHPLARPRPSPHIPTSSRRYQCKLPCYSLRDSFFRNFGRGSWSNHLDSAASSSSHNLLNQFDESEFLFNAEPQSLSNDRKDSDTGRFGRDDSRLITTTDVQSQFKSSGDSSSFGVVSCWLNHSVR